MKTTIEINTLIESLLDSAQGLRDFYETLFDESIDDFDASGERAGSVRSELWSKEFTYRELAGELEFIKDQ